GIIPKLVDRAWHDLKAFTDFGGARVIFKSFFNGDRFSTTAFVAKMRPAFEAAGVGIRGVYDGDGNVLLDEDGRPLKDWDPFARYLQGHPKRGHRAIHLVVEVDGKPVEIQLMTDLQSQWSRVQHHFYKNREGLQEK